MMRAAHRHAGFTLMEALVALLVTVGVVAAIMVATLDSGDSAKVAQSLTDLQYISDTIRLTYPLARERGYAGFSPGLVIDNLAQPIGKATQTQLANAWGGTIDMSAAPWDAEPNRAVRIAVSNVPLRLCVPLVQGVKDRFDAVAVNDTANVVRRLPNTELNGAEIADACAPPSGTVVTLYFTLL